MGLLLEGQRCVGPHARFLVANPHTRACPFHDWRFHL
jgi:hypothetical protein